MRIATDVAQCCVPKAGCGWLAESVARALLEVAPQHEHVWYHQFDTWINDSTAQGPVDPGGRAALPFRDLTAGQARAIWEQARLTGRVPGDPDVVHAHSFNAPPCGRSKLVFTAYDVSFWAVPEFTTAENRLVCQRGLLDALRHASAFFFISEFSRQECDRMLGGWLSESGRPIVVHPLAARHPAPPADWVKPRDGAWLAVGSLEPRKNLGTLLDAYAVYQQESPQPRPLRLVGGPGWLSDGLLRRIQQWPSAGSVQLAGYVSEAALLQEYQQAFALVFPSTYEGFGLPIVEAMQQATPVICGRVASLPEAAGDAALYVDPLDPRSIADALLALDARPALHAAHVARARQQAARHSWPQLARRLLELYEELLRT